MGKRELLLIVGFVVVGALVYQITAPPPAAGERAFSFGKILDNIRREIRGNRASGQATSTAIEPAEGLEEIRFRIRNGDISVIGEERQDIAAEMQVTSNGSDQAEAERLARATRLKFDRAGTTLDLTMVAPEPGIQRPTIVLKVPSRFRVRIDPSIGRLKIDNIAEVEIVNARGRSEIRNVAGRVNATTASGELIVASVGRLRVTSRSTDIQVEKVAQDATFSLRSGDLKARAIAGAIDLDSNNTDVTIDAAGTATGSIRATAVSGTLTVKGLRVDSRLEGRNTEIDVMVDRAAPLAIYSDGDEAVNLTPPASGYQLDAVAANGHITLADVELPVTTSGQEQRASGKVRGGGAAITIRSSRGDIKLRSRKSEG
jgi:DUF4097 and DUF4098 domain-containing protein YvlB